MTTATITALPSFDELAATTPEHSRCILVTNANNSGEDLMNFTRLPAEVLKAALEKRGFHFGDCYEIPAADLEFHCYEPNWLSEEIERHVLKLAAA